MKYIKGSFITVPNKTVLKGLLATSQALFMWICSYADEVGICFPSRKTLAEDLCVSLPTIDIHLKKLCEVGLIQKKTRKRGKENHTNLYQIILLPSKEFLPPSKENRTRVAKKTVQRTQSNELNPLNSTLLRKEQSFGKKEIKEILDSFENIMGFKSSGTKDRFMAKHLLNNFTMIQVKGMLQYCNQDKYAPRIGSVEKLWYKRGDVMAGIKKLQTKSNSNKPKGRIIS